MNRYVKRNENRRLFLLKKDPKSKHTVWITPWKEWELSRKKQGGPRLYQKVRIGQALNKGSVSSIHPKWLDCHVDEGSTSLVLWPFLWIWWPLSITPAILWIIETFPLQSSPDLAPFKASRDSPSLPTSTLGEYKEQPFSWGEGMVRRWGEKQQMTSCCIYPGSPSSKTHRPPSTHLATLRHHRITTGYLSRKTAIHACNCTLFYAKDTCQIQTFSDLAFLLTLTHVCVSPHKPGPRCPLNI